MQFFRRGHVTETSYIATRLGAWAYAARPWAAVEKRSFARTVHGMHHPGRKGKILGDAVTCHQDGTGARRWMVRRMIDARTLTEIAFGLAFDPPPSSPSGLVCAASGSSQLTVRNGRSRRGSQTSKVVRCGARRGMGTSVHASWRVARRRFVKCETNKIVREQQVHTSARPPCSCRELTGGRPPSFDPVT